MSYRGMSFFWPILLINVQQAFCQSHRTTQSSHQEFKGYMVPQHYLHQKIEVFCSAFKAKIVGICDLGKIQP